MVAQRYMHTGQKLIELLGACMCAIEIFCANLCIRDSVHKLLIRGVSRALFFWMLEGNRVFFRWLGKM